MEAGVEDKVSLRRVWVSHQGMCWLVTLVGQLDQSPSGKVGDDLCFYHIVSGTGIYFQGALMSKYLQRKRLMQQASCLHMWLSSLNSSRICYNYQQGIFGRTRSWGNLDSRSSMALPHGHVTLEKSLGLYFLVWNGYGDYNLTEQMPSIEVRVSLWMQSRCPLNINLILETPSEQAEWLVQMLTPFCINPLHPSFSKKETANALCSGSHFTSVH